jgi:hypothetical protein
MGTKKRKVVVFSYRSLHCSYEYQEEKKGERGEEREKGRNSRLIRVTPSVGTQE